MKRRCFAWVSIVLIAVCVTGIGFAGVPSAAHAYVDVTGCMEKLSSYATDYSSSSASRKHNIALAVKSVDGYVLGVGEEFSFNNVVGARTEENGYKKAKIIVKGKFTDGVGGGVCQVSTTLYNAVLRAGLCVKEAHSHSLPVGYVKPSFDAMVSGGTDLKFINDTPYPVHITGTADGLRIRFTVYGFPTITDGEKREFRSVKVRDVTTSEYEDVVDADGELKEGEEYRIIKEPLSGLVSEGYLDIYYRGELVESVRIRRDYYAPQVGVKLVKRSD